MPTVSNGIGEPPLAGPLTPMAQNARRPMARAAASAATLVALFTCAALANAPVESAATEALKSATQISHKKVERHAKVPPVVPRAATPGKLWTDATTVEPRPTSAPSIPQLVRATMPAVVGIVATTTSSTGVDAADPFHDFLEKMYGAGGEKSEPVRGIGTGFIVRADGLVVTNGHVVEGASDIQLQLGPLERPVKAHVVGRDDPTDIALLKIDAAGPFPVVPLGDSDAADVGEWVVAIGNPFGLSRTVTTGIISYKGRRDVNPSGRPGYYDFIQTDAAINPGNSGGPLLDARGAVVGINAAVNPSGQGIGFAVPINMVKTIIPQLYAKGYVKRSWMGLSIQESISPELATSFGAPEGKGVLVTEITADGPADQAGLKVGDIITTFDGESLSESWRLRWLSSITGVDKSVKLGYVREGKEAFTEVTLRERPGAAPSSPPKEQPFNSKDPLGAVVDDAADAEGGVRITSVDVRGPAYRVGLREGDVITEVNGAKVADKEAFHAAIGKRSATGISRLFVRRGGRPIFFALRREPSPPAAAQRQADAEDDKD